MPSVYDERAKCRVGEMDEAQFFAESDPDNGAFFAVLMKAWTEAGGRIRWGAGGAGLRATGSGPGGKEVGVCFLAPKYAGKQDRVELSCTPLKKQIGEDAVDALHAGLRSAAGTSVKGTTMVSVVCPGRLPAKAQRAVIDSLLATVGRA